MNPFLNNNPIYDRSKWYGSSRLFERLEESVSMRINTCIMGPAGSGKTSLLHTFFSYDYRKRMAQEEKTLIYSVDLSARSGGEDMCACLADNLKDAVVDLLEESEELPGILSSFRSIDTSSAQTRLSTMIRRLGERFHYFVIVVMDGFERFTNSELVTAEHHEIMRSLIEADKLRCIVATRYDLSKDSLPPGTKGSMYLQKLTSRFTMEPLSREDAVRCLMKLQERGDGRYPLSEGELGSIWRMTGGIPGLMKSAAAAAYSYKNAHEGKLNGKEVTALMQTAAVPYFQSWCKLLTAQQEIILSGLATDVKSQGMYAERNYQGASPEQLEAVTALINKGLLRKAPDKTDAFGNPEKAGDYQVRFCALLFQNYCSKRENLPGRAAALSLMKSEEFVLPEPAAEPRPSDAAGDIIRGMFPGVIEPQRPVIINVIQGDVGMIDQGEHRETNNIIHLNYQISPTDLLRMLEDGGEQSPRKLLGEHLAGYFRNVLPPAEKLKLARRAGMSDEEYESECDRRMDEVSGKIVQEVEVDDHDHLVNVDERDLQTLDERFNEAAGRCGLHIDEALLRSMSERCRFYLKLAVVVEDALNLPGMVEMEDYSPQLVLYGKALEQALRDCFYELFRKDPQLAVYDYKKHAPNPGQGETFRCKAAQETFIGNYAYVIQGCRDYLGTLCLRHRVFLMDGSAPSDWKRWWDVLKTDIHNARKIRNLTDHADPTSPDRSKLKRMNRLLFGSGKEMGILERIQVGPALHGKLSPRT